MVMIDACLSAERFYVNYFKACNHNVKVRVEALGPVGPIFGLIDSLINGWNYSHHCGQKMQLVRGYKVFSGNREEQIYDVAVCATCGHVNMWNWPPLGGDAL